MRIALVCSEVIRESGHGRYMLELARRLAAAHEVHVYSDLFDPLPGVTHHRVPAPTGINLLRVYAFWWRASRALRGVPYDIVHTIGGCCARHDVVTVQFAQRPWGAQLAKLEAQHRQTPVLVGSPLRRLYHQLYWRLCDLLEAPAFRSKHLIAVSEGVRDELHTFYGTPKEDVTVVYNGVEPGEWADLAALRAPTRQALGLADEPAMLFVGDFYRKGLATVIAALARHPVASLIVVGRGEEGAFRAQARDLGVEDRLRFVGFQKDVRPYFAAADMFVFPTRYEPFGMVVTEAMAAGLAVITTRAAGAAEVITAGVDGIVLDDPEDVAALAEAMGELLADAGRRQEMGAAARRAAARVSWDYVVTETLAVYRAVGVR
ncbi:MAG: glycosyltransferase family 1 protein [Cyanobacteria bacterium RYN_339]|nr:glycosyltransferase family 1 protein [Cyanobacteria bacterium RYN_339]